MDALAAWSTFALAVFTLGLVLLAGVNFHKFVQNVRLIANSIELQAKSIEAQRDAINLQTEISHLEHRPYLYLYMNTLGVGQKKPGEAWFGGGSMRFRNVGRDPASNIKTQHMVASDTLNEIDFVGWFEKAFGGFPHINSVFPGQEDAEVPCHPMISTGDKKPKLMYIGAVVTYEGPKSGMIYWYKFSRVYAIKFSKEKDKEGLVKVSIYPLKADHDWDKNLNGQPPKLELPNWKNLLSKSYINQITSEE